MQHYTIYATNCFAVDHVVVLKRALLIYAFINAKRNGKINGIGVKINVFEISKKRKIDRFKSSPKV